VFGLEKGEAEQRRKSDKVCERIHRKGNPSRQRRLISVKEAITAFQSQNAELAETVRATISYTLMALRRLEPDRDELGL
jgi:hypothetical protein